MSAEEKNHFDNRNRKPKKSQEDKEIETVDLESTAGGMGGGGG